MVSDDFIKAGQIAAQAREYGRKLIKENASTLEIAEKIENKITELGGKIAFPVDISCNHIAAHDSPIFNDARLLKNGDLVKLDLGVHVNGYVVDTACTVEVGDAKHAEMINAVEEALGEAIKIFKPGTKIGDVGARIEKIIKDKNFSPVRNLSGHEVGYYTIHAGITIPNYNNGNQAELQENQIFAIEPFATTGDGIVIEGKPAEVYAMINEKPVRDENTRMVLAFIKEDYKTLPFAKRWIAKKFNMLKANIALTSMERTGIIKQYSRLVERTKKPVAQAEHTVVVADNPIVLTK